MTIDTAIAILNDRLTQGRAVTGEPLFTAIQLSREALKRLKEGRIGPELLSTRLLPGETKD